MMKSNSPRLDLSIPAEGPKAANPLAEHVGLSLICPCCDTLLKKVRHELGIAWRCAGCGGQSLNFSQFRRMIPELRAKEIWLTIMENPALPKRHTLCPECRKAMSAVLIPYQGKEIELNICARCQRLWLEKQQTQQTRHILDEVGTRHRLR